MIDAKRAVLIAKEKSDEMIGVVGSLEEIERDSYKGREIWSITLGFPSTGFNNVLNGLRDYKRFLIDAETGDLVAMKLREVALP